jgi:hypothetical protein
MIKNKRKITSKTWENTEETKFKISSLINLSLILTIVTICFYFLGVRYQTAFFQTYGIEVNTFLFSYESYFIAIGNEIISFVFVGGLLISILLMSSVITEIKPPRAAAALRRDSRKFAKYVENKWSPLKGNRARSFRIKLKAFFRKYPVFGFKYNLIKFSGYYLMFYFLCWTIILISGYSIFKVTTGAIDLMSEIAQKTAMNQCKQKKAIQIELKPELKEKIPLPATTYFFSYLGDKYVVFFDENTDCSKLGNGSGFFVLNRGDITKISFNSSVPSN